VDEQYFQSVLIQQKAIIEAQIEALGMQAENMKRQCNGESMAYTYDNFMSVIGNMNAIFEAGRL
jgi:hypothetical protein